MELLLNRQSGSKDGVINYINNLCFGSVTTSPFLEFGGPQNSLKPSKFVKFVELRIKVDLHLGQKVEEEEDFHVTKISSLSTKAISTTKLD